MASSDDEDDTVLQSVTNYYFLEGKEDEPISFSVLPVLFDEAEKPAASEEQVFLHGNGDGGLQKVYKQVTGWKVELKDDQPEVYVLSRDSKWIKLLKPRKSYEVCIRKILITIQLLHFLRRKPESSEKNLWGHLRKVFSSLEDRPSVNDLIGHYPLIQKFVEKDDALSKSQLLMTFLSDKPTKKTSSEDLENDSDSKKPFIVDDDVDDDGNESEEETDLFDYVCAICDNGGELLCCEGTCLRSFHATRRAGEDSDCKSLGYTRTQVEAIQNFLCRNCKLKRHQCFACGKLGSSDKSAGAEVFQCASATCGHFYHPKCAADILFPNNETEALECRKKIADGQSFTCPVHKCCVCKQVENKQERDLQFAVCRRCPKAYHRKCLPRKIAFEDIEEEGVIQRAWDDLLPNRILIYCLKHRIDDDLGTPIRNHIIFAEEPEDPEKKKVLYGQKTKPKVLVKKKYESSAGLVQDRGKPVKSSERISSSEDSQPVVRTGRSVMSQVLDFQKQLKPLKDTALADKRKIDGSSVMDNKRTSKENNKASKPAGSEASFGKKFISSHPKIDGETEKKISSLVQKASSSLTLEDIIKKRAMPSTHAHTSRNVDKSITLGKVERSVGVYLLFQGQALKTALQKLDANGSVEDAKAVCEPDILRQLQKWNRKLKVYLAPFLHGMRYTSYGRHFTKKDKLKEIVDKLQWYVQNGDMIVDFCCGANDFSQLMKETLDASGKKCLFKNYDVIQPKNDFNFERRDWMKVQPDELPTGSQLIMGLNPPFGVQASLANKFIDKALSFKPKLVILIVPEETERLDRKKPPYDLIWEDGEFLSGKSFYLPGSVDENDKQMDQWNNKPPPLYLWSRRDWTSKHMSIASKHDHVPKDCDDTSKDGSRVRNTMDALPMEENVEERRVQREAVSTEESKREEKWEKSEVICAEETGREGNRNGENSKKRNSPEGKRSRSASKRAKKRKLKSKQQETLERNGVEQVKNEAQLSDMSISPPHASDAAREPSRSRNEEETSVNFRAMPVTNIERPSNQMSGLDFERIAGGPSATIGRDESVKDIAMRYSSLPTRDGLYTGSSHPWSNNDIVGRDLGSQHSEDRYAGYSHSDSFARTFRSGYGAPLDAQQARPYSLQEHEDPLPRSRYSLGDFGSAPGHTSIYSSSSYGLSSSAIGSSAMQRYAPRLDETNYAMGPGNPGPNVPLHGPTRDVPSDSFFAPGPRHPFPPQGGSGGWLND
ncbi:protein ENHANCED DOWNY MILDEW 2-like isoform X2 [Iris pallida]|uniref:Protein ENHANCED DOWNY MILDEW 2-like isoform X2 n=1 Tax=Iris pallida TaxID=29817 RepID=A0AAX6G8D9_IRIPA|nr:protein ENHANCED DOWNY MILDEW 2-like isoform X2 [Iris pallida]